MSTMISVLGGVGLFLLGMSVMTNGLKALAGSGLRTTLSKVAATPLSGAFWGAFVTLIVQSSSATTMTTIGLVSAGLLTFPQGLGLVFGANVGTTGTAWLVALIGVRVSLTSRGPAGGSRRSRCRMVVGDARRVDAGPSRARDDSTDAVVNGGRCGDAVRLLRRCGRAGPGLRVDHRAEHRNGDQLRVSGYRREHYRQAAGHRVCTVQTDCCRDRVGAFSHCNPSARPCLEHD